MANVGIDTGGAEFFGVKSTGSRFVFVVDGSNSMGRGTKWDDCKREMMASVNKLSPKQFFYVYLFARNSYRMFDEDVEQSGREARRVAAVEV